MDVETRQGPLANIRVLDLGKYIAGPYAANVLAEFGADVIRIERPGGADDRFVIPVTGDERSIGATYLNNNRDKRSLVLDLADPSGRKVFERLLATADVVVINVPPTVLASLKLDYETLASIKPDIILAVATAYGTAGPYRDQAGFDAVGQCLSGAVDLTGQPDYPTRGQAAYCDFGTALYLAVGVMAALMERAQTGLGQQVEASLLHTGLAFVSQFLTEQAMVSKNRPRTGNRGQTSGPIDIFKTRDGRVLIFALGDAQFRRVARIVGHPEWIEDPRFKTDELRGVNGALLSEAIAPWCAGMSSKEVLAKLEEGRIPASPVLSLQQALENEHIKANGFLKTLSFPGVEKPVPVVEIPVRLSRAAPRTRRRPPELGEHSSAILGELGLSVEEIRGLEADGVVQLEPSATTTT